MEGRNSSALKNVYQYCKERENPGGEVVRSRLCDFVAYDEKE